MLMMMMMVAVCDGLLTVLPAPGEECAPPEPPTLAVSGLDIGGGGGDEAGGRMEDPKDLWVLSAVATICSQITRLSEP